MSEIKRRETINSGLGVHSDEKAATRVKQDSVHFALDGSDVKLILENGGKRLPFDQENILTSVREILGAGVLSKSDENDFRMQVCAMFKVPTNLIDLPANQMLELAKEAGVQPDPHSERTIEVSRTSDFTKDEEMHLASPFAPEKKGDHGDETTVSVSDIVEKALADDPDDDEALSEDEEVPEVG